MPKSTRRPRSSPSIAPRGGDSPGSPASARRVSRRVGAAAIAAVLLVALGVGAWWWLRGAAIRTVEGPIVLISIDTLRADRLPVYGYTRGETPHIDALAREAVVFDRAYAHSPQTLPSHASLFTGLLPFEHGVRDNLGFALERGARTLAGLLRERGYATGGFVSAYVMRGETGVGQGFDTFDDRLPPASSEVGVGEVQRAGLDTLGAAERWLDSLASRRAFLFLHLYEPHTPYTPPARYRRLDPYDGEIALADEIVGRLLASLRRRGLYDGALIVLLSDHGEGLGDHGEQEHGLFLYNETIRVPLVVKLPGQRGGGRRVAAPVQHVDLLPTVLALAGAPVPAGLRGRALVPVFDGGTIPEQGLYAEALYPRYHFGWSELYALTDARYRFIRAPRDELYDVEQDAAERRNLAPGRPQTVGAMRQALDRLLAGAAIDAPAAVSEDDRERLRALGYVGSQVAATSAPGAEALPDPKDKVGVLERYRQALELVRGGRTDEAIDEFRGIAAENPGMADVWDELAGLLSRQGRTREAVDAYRREVEATPHNPAALVSVAQALVQLGDLDEAGKQAELALDLLPEQDSRWRAAAHTVLMRLALTRKDPAAARAQAARARGADPESPLPDYAEGLIRYDAGQFAEAVPRFEAALRLSRPRTFQLPELRYHLGDSLARLERYAEAEPVLTDEVRLFPQNLRARAALALLYRAQGRTAESDQAVDGLVRTAPTAEGYGLAAQLWTMFGEPQKAAAARAAGRRKP